MPIRIMASRHSAFYSPLLCCITALKSEGQDVAYSVLGPGQRGYALLRDGQIDIMQSAVSSNWNLREMGVEPLPVHFAQINRRDGFFLAAREPDAAFDWKKLEGKTLLADHGPQPLAMLKFAVRENGADWRKIKAVNKGTPAQMATAFAGGLGDYIHLQGPVVGAEMVVSVGASMPPVAFSSLCCSGDYQKTDAYKTFLTAFARTKEWIQTAPAAEAAAAASSFFPDVDPQLLASTIERYQALGCWEGGIEIPRDLYEQALNVFQAAGAVAWRHRYEEVVR